MTPDPTPLQLTNDIRSAIRKLPWSERCNDVNHAIHEALNQLESALRSSAIPPSDVRVIHSSEIADDPGGFQGDYVPLEDHLAALRGSAEPRPAREADPNDGGFGEAAYCHHRHHLNTDDEIATGIVEGEFVGFDHVHTSNFNTCDHYICRKAREAADPRPASPLPLEDPRCGSTREGWGVSERCSYKLGHIGSCRFVPWERPKGGARPASRPEQE